MRRNVDWSIMTGVASLLAFLVALIVPSTASSQIGAWIDPGHGDGCRPVGAAGANGNTPPDEKDLTLQVADRVVNRLLALGSTCAITRSSDHCLSRKNRLLMAKGLFGNDEGVTEEGVTFVSIHMDGEEDPNKKGTFVIYPRPQMVHRKSLTSYRVDSTLASYVNGPLQSNAAAAFLGCYENDPLLRDPRGLDLLVYASVRTCIVECCTISNQCQFNNIVQGGDQGLIADGIATGISNYLGAGLVAGPPSGRRAFNQATALKPYSIVAPPRTLAGAVSEGFEGVSFPPNGWSLTSSGVGPPYTWYRTTDPLYVAAGSGAALVQGEYAGATDERLISPMFRVTAADSSLRFRWLGNPTFSADVMGSCAVRRKGDASWTDIWTLGQENTGLAFSKALRTVSLRSWLGDSVQVSFRVVGTDGADFGVDDIATGVLPLTGSPPNDLCQLASPLPAGSFSFTGNTCYAANNRDPSTGGSSCVAEDAAGGDVFYSLHALVNDTLQVHLNDASAALTELYLLSSCDSTSATCLSGKQASGGEIDSTLTYVFSTSGTYYLAVDAMDGSCGDFVLTGTWRGPVTAVGSERPFSNRFSLIAWPNPARGVTMRFGRIDSGLRGAGRLLIVDAAGRIVHERHILVGDNAREMSWDGRAANGSHVPPGRYLARVSVGDQSVEAPFVIVN